MSKETSHSVSCITIVSGLNVSFITNDRLIFSHNITLNDWNRILGRYFRQGTSFQKGFVILLFELKLYLWPNFSRHWEDFIINRSCRVRIRQLLELSLRAINNFFWNRLYRCALQHVHELTWFNINSVSTLHRNCSSCSDNWGFLFLIFHYLNIAETSTLTLIASLRGDGPDWRRSWLYTFVVFVKNFLYHLV